VETENELGPMLSALRKEIQQSTISITRKLNLWTVETRDIWSHDAGGKSLKIVKRALTNMYC
jgi:hypothetical protein